MNDSLKDILGIPLFPHLYAIPMTVIFGMVIGYFLRGKMEGKTPEKLPTKPKLDDH